MTHDEAMEHEFHLTLKGKDLSTILYALEFCADKCRKKIVNGYERADSKTEDLLNQCIYLSYRLDVQYIKELEKAEGEKHDEGSGSTGNAD